MIIQKSGQNVNDNSTRIKEIETKAEQLKQIAEKAASTGQLPDFGKPYEELTGIERQLYDLALSRQALETQIHNSCEQLNKRVGNLYDKAGELKERVNTINAEANELGENLSKNKWKTLFKNIFKRIRF